MIRLMLVVGVLVGACGDDPAAVDAAPPIDSLAFDANTVLSDANVDAPVPDARVPVNLTTGALTSVQNLGQSHHAIAFHSGGLLYHFHEGETAPPELDTVDVAGGGVSPIASSGSTTDQVGAALWSETAGVFLLSSSRNTSVYTATTAGVISPLGTAPARMKGFAFAPTP